VVRLLTLADVNVNVNVNTSKATEGRVGGCPPSIVAVPAVVVVVEYLRLAK
jgi:hypothetical protein